MGRHIIPYEVDFDNNSKIYYKIQWYICNTTIINKNNSNIIEIETEYEIKYIEMVE